MVKTIFYDKEAIGMKMRKIVKRRKKKTLNFIEAFWLSMKLKKKSFFCIRYKHVIRGLPKRNIAYAQKYIEEYCSLHQKDILIYAGFSCYAFYCCIHVILVENIPIKDFENSFFSKYMIVS